MAEIFRRNVLEMNHARTTDYGFKLFILVQLCLEYPLCVYERQRTVPPVAEGNERR